MAGLLLVDDPSRLSLNSPYAVLLPASAIAGCELHEIPPDAGLTATYDSVRDVLLNTRYNCLIVDTFARGLGGELADILPQLQNTPRKLIHRDINPRYYIVAKDLRRFVASNFDLVILPGEGDTVPLLDLPQVRHTAAWLIRSADELPDINKARLLLRLDPGDCLKTVVVCAAGQTEELAWYSKLTSALAESLSGVAVRCLAAKCPDCASDLWVFHYPGMECLLAANVVVGGGGYNTFYECAALQVPLVTFTMNRRYDRA